MARNAAELRDAARASGLDLGIYFARKANKALAFVDEARRLGLGVDVASERELAQVLERGVAGSALVMTAAVKPEPLLALCIASGTTVVVDNADELRRLARLADDADTRRLGRVAAGACPSRRSPADALRHGPRGGARRRRRTARRGCGSTACTSISTATTRRTASRRSSRRCALVDALRARGHAPAFVDIGGGIPMSYIDDPAPGSASGRAHRAALLGHGPQLTFDGHGLGLLAHRGEIVGRPAVYPFHQSPIRGDWLTQILRAPLASHAGSVADGLLARGLQLRCEPGRALLDGCGMTAARVSFRKQRRDGTWLIGAEMNRTQCRSTSEDFLVDPLLIHPDDGDASDPAGHPTGPIEGYLVGAYCIERELLTWRRMRFAHGVDVGDIVVFPNTAGYLMHILESSSHQIPLARNLLLGADGPPRLDPIDD